MIRLLKYSLRIATVIIGLVIALMAQDAFAQSGASSKSKSSKRTTVDFEDQLVEGQVQKPELFYLLQQRNNNYKRLIRLRENFLPEMRKTSEDIGRPNGKGSAN